MDFESPKPSALNEPFEIALNDPLAKELVAVQEWVEAAAQKAGTRFYAGIELKALPCGEQLLQGDVSQLRRNVMAALAHGRHWDRQQDLIRSTAEDDHSRYNAHQLPGWGYARGRALQVQVVFETLMRRKLPFTREDLLDFLAWGKEVADLNRYSFPVSSVCKAISNYASANKLTNELTAAIAQFAARLRGSRDKDEKKYATSLEQIIGGDPIADASNNETAFLPSPLPAPVGTPGVQITLKQLVRIKEDLPSCQSTTLAPDQFRLREDSPLRKQHDLLSDLFISIGDQVQYHHRTLESFGMGQALDAMSPLERGWLLSAAIERFVGVLQAKSSEVAHSYHYAARAAVRTILEHAPELQREMLFEMLIYLALLPDHLGQSHSELAPTFVERIAEEAKRQPLSEGERYALSLFRASLIGNPVMGNSSAAVAAITALIGDGATYFLAPSDAWAEFLNREIASGDVKARRNWVALLKHLLSATSSRPSGKWLKTATSLVEALGAERVRDALVQTLPLVSNPSPLPQLGSGEAGLGVMNDDNADALRGLLWCIPLLPDRDELARLATAVAISAYKKVPGVGPRATKVGNAAIYCLSELGTKEAVGQLAMLKVRVKFGSAQKEIEKAFDAAAAALELPRDQIEELGVPSYGLEEVGKLTETLGDYRAELIVTGSDAALNWFDEKGKQLKSVPAKVKSDHKEALKELQQSLKDIQSMLPAQRDRIDALFLAQKTWSIDDWRERYHDHPLVGTIAQRLIWLVDGAPALFVSGEPTDVAGKPIEHGKTAEVALWHPVGRPIDEIVAWRRRLETLQITQPFKQAHREVYLLTDAERNTNTYSNRYAAHVIRQHQFNALCGARRWKNKLRLCVDDYFPPATRELPLWGLRAEFWIEGLGDDFGVDTNDSGVYLRLTTDQVRFYREGASTNMAHAGGGGYGSNAVGPGTDHINEPLPLDQIPPLVFSEIMRDVDLFVGVASIGNDPTWQDGGPEGRFRDYWQGYSFGELSGTATTRKEVLERLVPRLKIASRCSFSERFLVVRGDKRTYKIHLGSGNILMEPNDQYLCIVPDAKARASQDDMYLPFEGDNVLSIIISKALLLAEDTKIKDPTITRQIELK